MRTSPGIRRAASLPATPLADARAVTEMLVARALRSATASRMRSRVDGAIDSVRLRLDHAGLRAYQPAPALGRAHALRADGTDARWNAMLPVLDEVRPRSAVDIGCNAGWFTIRLASMGIPTTGVESDPPMYRTAILGARRSGVRGAAILVMNVDPTTVALLPRADCVLLLSVWHHFVRDFGLSAADELLAGIWRTTGKVLFFETGEAECEQAFGLPPMVPSPGAWVAGHLERVCAGGRVEHLGSHPAFGPDGAPCERNLFAVHRVAAA